MQRSWQCRFVRPSTYANGHRDAIRHIINVFLTQVRGHPHYVKVELFVIGKTMNLKVCVKLPPYTRLSRTRHFLGGGMLCTGSDEDLNNANEHVAEGIVRTVFAEVLPHVTIHNQQMVDDSVPVVTCQDIKVTNSWEVGERDECTSLVADRQQGVD